GFIALSWIGVAAVYYAMSLLLQNEKYRWMALLTLALTVLYVFIIGIALLEPTYRIISFLGLGFALVVISLLYTKKRLKK
ncbi:MAG: DUF2339 domain-containing protein, partial [Ignavibacteriales bacterium]|nr:DUF2339 domain-containing protein [Ignavibacteriales bacterium]